MSSDSKSSFYARPNIRTLTPALRLQRWRQHLASLRGNGSNNRRKVRASVSSGFSSLETACAQAYAQSLVNPFDSPPVCVPTFPAITSRKVKVFTRGVSTIGTAGFGFVLVSPSIASDRASCHFSLATFTGTVVSEPPTTGVDSAFPNSDYDSAEFDSSPDGVAGKLVSSGLRVRYIGTELNRSGQVVILTHPDNLDLSGASLADMQAFESGQASQCSREWASTTWVPLGATDVEYRSSAAVSPFSTHSMAVVFTGVPGEQYSFEVSSNFEVVGSRIRGKTPSFAAIDLFGRISNRVSTLKDVAWRYITNNPASVVRLANSLLGIGAPLAVRTAPGLRIEEVD